VQRGKALGYGALGHRTEVGFLKQLHLVLRRKKGAGGDLSKNNNNNSQLKKVCVIYALI
jgi:hypothetical protein